nr:MAG TPA: hypothetical protein [Myoviridae sp. ctyhU11]
MRVANIIITSCFVSYLFLYFYYSKLLHESQYFYAKVNTFTRKFFICCGADAGVGRKR